MFNQDWHAVTDITDDGGNVAGDAQATRAWTAVLRMDDLPARSPGPQVVLRGFGEYEGPDIIRVMVQIAYEVRVADGTVRSLVYDPDSSDRAYTRDDLGNGTVARVARQAVAAYAACADLACALDWNGEDPVNRKGGFVRVRGEK